MTTTIKTYKDWGPYLHAARFDYEVTNLGDFIRQVRICMEDNDCDVIGVYHGDTFVGGWTQECDYEPDYEDGGYYCTSANYVRPQPNSFDWECIKKHCFHPGIPVQLTHPIIAEGN